MPTLRGGTPKPVPIHAKILCILQSYYFDLSKTLLESLDKLLESLKKNVGTQIKAVRDETDDMLVQCAVECKAEFIVSLDDDLLSLKKFGPVKIIRPSEFLNLLRKEKK